MQYAVSYDMMTDEAAVAAAAADNDDNDNVI